MNKLLLISLSLLAGIAMAGVVWYVWGLAENMKGVKRQRIARKEARRLEEEASPAAEDAEDNTV
jgi:hypothetical protein